MCRGHYVGVASPLHIVGLLMWVEPCWLQPEGERRGRELSGPRSRAPLVVLAGKIRGRWSKETRFLSLLAKAKQALCGQAKFCLVRRAL